MTPAGIPYRSLLKTALLTLPLLAIGFAGPIFIASGADPELLWMAILGAMGVCTLAWLLNLAFLRFRERLGKWKWVQIFAIGGTMIGISFIGFAIIGDHLPTHAARLAPVRYVNAFALNAIIYILIDLRLLSDTKARLAEENAQLRMSGLETQYQILKDQLNPHFLFNAIGTARSLSRRDPELTEAYLIRLSEFLRATLQDRRDAVPLATELRVVEDYIALQKMRFQSALVIEVDPALAEKPFEVPYFAVLTLVENAVKHNAMSQEMPLTVRITRVGDALRVWNNRQHKPLPVPSNGSGLRNLRDRLRILGLGDLHLEENPAEFSVTLPLRPA